jgi:hypothetical protein
MHPFAFLAFLLIALPLVAFACPPPFNNMDFLGNETHISSELIEVALNQQGMSWVDGVSEALRNPSKPWPRDQETSIVTIKFCFLDEASRITLRPHVSDALNFWFRFKLGPPGKDTAMLFSSELSHLSKDKRPSTAFATPPT